MGYCLLLFCKQSRALCGSVDISWGIVTKISLEGCTHRLADVGNRVHTRNDSDENVRSNAYHQAIAWRALPWSFIIQAFFLY